MVYAVDFDGTLCVDRYPEIGEPRERVIEAVRRLRCECGGRLILWTCRGGDMNKSLFSSACDEWETPPDLFAALDKEFHFTLDACALPETAKCPRYFTPEDDGLSRPWAEIGGVLFSAIRRIRGGQRTSPVKRTGSRRPPRRAPSLGQWWLCSSRPGQIPPPFTGTYTTGQKSALSRAGCASA